MLFWLLMLILIIILGTAAYGGKSAAIWVPMARGDAVRTVDLAAIQQGDVVYDLGCGDGRVVIAAAERGATAIGYEISFVPYLLATIRSWVSRPMLGSCSILYRNFWKQDISDADVVCIYLIPAIYDKVIQKITTECTPGTRIITYVWEIPNWQVEEVSERMGKPKIWRYIVGSSENRDIRITNS